MNIFWIDETRKIQKTYNDLFQDICNKKEVARYISYEDPYQIFVELLCSLLIDEPIEVFDASLSALEKEKLGISTEKEQEKVPFKCCQLGWEDLEKVISGDHKKWSITLFTSGTTGKPKKVAQGILNLTRRCKTGDRFSDNVWAFAYHPTHFAGLQVFFQALLNANTMVYIFDQSNETVFETLQKYQVTHMSATPTFYRTITPYILNPILTLRRITLGGEKFDTYLSERLMHCFPHAKIRNVYASTEAGSIFESENNLFPIKEALKENVKVNGDGELLLSDKILGDSEDFKLNNGWYYTGDIVRIIEDKYIEFIGRKTEMINIGGYKVNPQEIEEEMMKIDGIVDVSVRERANRMTGNIIVADVLKQDSAKELDEVYIFKILKERLQVWKIPRIINIVTSIDKTRTGKKVRK